MLSHCMGGKSSRYDTKIPVIFRFGSNHIVNLYGWKDGFSGHDVEILLVQKLYMNLLRN